MTPLVSTTLGWIWQGLLAFLLLGLAFSALVGLTLALRPDAMLAVHHRWSRWVDTGPLFQKLDLPRWRWEPWFYRNHRLVGGLIALGAGYVLAQWAFAFDRAQALRALAPRLAPRGLDWVAAGLEWTMVVTHVVALAIGLIMIVRPSLLKGLESEANRWHASGRLMERLDRRHDPLERVVTVYPRVMGVVLACVSAYCLSALAVPVLAALR